MKVLNISMRKLVYELILFAFIFEYQLFSFQGDVITSFYFEKKGDSLIILDDINLLQLGVDNNIRKVEKGVQTQSKYIDSVLSLWQGQKKDIFYQTPQFPESKLALSNRLEEFVEGEEKVIEKNESPQVFSQTKTDLTLKSNVLPVSFSEVIGSTQNSVFGSSYIMGLTTVGMFFWLLDSEDGTIEKIEPERGNTIEVAENLLTGSQKTNEVDSLSNIQEGGFSSSNSANSAVQYQEQDTAILQNQGTINQNNTPIFDNGLIVYTAPNNFPSPFGDSLVFSGAYGETPTPLPPSLITTLVGIFLMSVYYFRFSYKRRIV